jgi:Xaa-Pro aminopeptidase
MTGLGRVLDAMDADDVDVLLLGREANARFVSGAERLFLAGERAFAPGCVVARSAREVYLLSTGDAGIPPEVARANLYPLSWNPANLFGRIAALPGVAGARRVGVDGITPLFEQLIGAYFAGAELVDGEALLRDVRRVKSPDELAMVRAAIAVAEAVMADARAAALDGAPDAAIVAVAMASMASHGVTTAAFEPVIRGAGDVVAIDIGVLRHGWEGGLARTAPGGPAADAHVEAITACRAGASLASIADRSAVHGIGAGYEVLDPERPLQTGMVLSIATNDIRDIVLVTAHQPELLTTAPY